MSTKFRSAPFILKLSGAFALLAAMFVIAVTSGAADVPLRDVARALFTNATNDNILMLREIRLPREIAAIAVGAALAVAGAIMQGITRNPLADPGLLGLTAGASAALSVTFVFFPAVQQLGIVAACFAGAALGTLLVFGIGSMRRGGFSPMRIVLAGAAVSAFLYAVSDGVSIFFGISQDVSLWTAGGLIGTTWGQLGTIGPFIAAGLLVAILLSRQLTILSLNEDVAIGLGQRIVQTKAILFAVIVVLAGSSVALVGNIAFVGLLVPHIARAVVGTDYRCIIPMSAVLGAALMTAADTLGRTINAPYETPVVAIVAMMGLPFFLWIVRQGGRAYS